MTLQTLPAIVHGLRLEASNVISIELRPVSPETLFPVFEAGAHLDLHLPNGMVRSYSLTNPTGTPDRYVVAVLNDPNSRGGSRFIHEQLRVGTQLQISAPRNLFRLNEAAPHSFLLAGGIGITPLYGMFQRLAQLGKSVDLMACARQRRQIAFLNEIKSLESADRRLHLHLDEEAGGPPDLLALLGAQKPDTHFYCCGPQPMLQAFEQACATLGFKNVHVERFSAAPAVAEPAPAQESYTVELRKSARTLEVSSTRPLLDSLLEAGIEASYSCREGICGACETPVLEGEVNHRDSILSPGERQANRSMMLCVSHCKSGRLVLDL
jgi:ferredoxin-NADP reductase